MIGQLVTRQPHLRADIEVAGFVGVVADEPVPLPRGAGRIVDRQQAGSVRRGAVRGPQGLQAK